MRGRYSLDGPCRAECDGPEELGARYGIPDLHADYRSLLDAGEPRRDRRLLACRHARGSGARRSSRPGCTSSSRSRCASRSRTPTAIVAARDAGGEGRPGRNDEALRPVRRADDRRAARRVPTRLRYVSVVVYDPEFEPYFEAGNIVRGGDVARRADRSDPERARRRRWHSAVGSGGEDVVRAFSRELPRQHAPRPQRRPRRGWRRWASRFLPRSSRATGGTRGARSQARCACGTAPAATSPGSRSSGTFEYRETINSSSSVTRCARSRFPSPWLKQHPTLYRRTGRGGPHQRRPGRTLLRRVVRARARALPRLHRRRG